MCTKPALRAPPLRLPALRALPPLMLMMRPQPAVFMKGMTAREQRSAPTYFTLKSSIKSSSMTVSIGPVAVADPPGAEPLLTRMCRPPSCCAAYDDVVEVLHRPVQGIFGTYAIVLQLDERGGIGRCLVRVDDLRLLPLLQTRQRLG